MLPNYIDKFFTKSGRYFIMLGQALKRPQKMRVFSKLYFREVDDLGFNSMGIVAFLSFFVGAVVALQMAFNLDGSGFIPKYYVAYATRESVILEFSPTIISIILCGKVGSYIASSIGTMRVTEQIEALDVMGVNSINYLVLPKIAAMLSFMPVLIMTSMLMAIFGGWIAAITSGTCTSAEYIYGLRMPFDTFYITYAMIKSEVFAFVVATLPAFFGYYIKGGALEVGRASTNAVVWSSIVIIILNYVLTQTLLG
ncbi:MAG: ABC transporter permease [Flavobacteriales bacterium]|nr:ABC transporter permease [Flavobacteriales bacterium]PWM12593.1 MAG: ABC transporter permease [Flavobacteriales bacterium]